MQHIRKQDPEIYDHMIRELRRQQTVIELIASENLVSPAILEAAGSWLTNKYSEGYPGKRYYGGNQHIDSVENIARERAKQLFGAEHANVQPHSGSQANAAAYLAILKPGDTVLGMNLDHGGHLTHGSKVNFSGKHYTFIPYGLSEKTQRIDMNQVRALAQEHRPKLLLAGYSAYPRTLDFAKFREIADEINAYFMVDMAHFAGLVAAKLYPDPVPHAHIVTSTSHKTLRGPRGAFILCQTEDPYGSGKRTLAQKIDSAVFPGTQGGPLDHIIAAKAIAFSEAMQPEFAEYQKRVIANAHALAHQLEQEGIPLVTGGTDNHLLLVDLRTLGVEGKIAEHALDEAGICTNKNMIPYDTASPFNPSGLRIGTPAVTTRGMREDDMKRIGSWIVRILQDPHNSALQHQIRQEVRDLCSKHPLYEDLEEKLR